MPIFPSLYQGYKKHIPLLLSLLLTTPILFFQSFRYSYPLGYAGMFTMIAEDIADAGFALPLSIPHYGPGGIDMVYPPFAMYVFALAMKIGAPTWAYLRLMPAIFTLLTIIPLFYLALELFESRIASLVSVVLVMTAPAVYYTHVWSAGIVRALALGFCLTGLLFYIRSIRNFSVSSFLLAGVSLGLLLTTHLLYVLFAALVGLACLLSEWSWKRLLISTGILLTALLVASPWLFIVIERHGLSSLLAAYSSHRNVDFILSLKEIPAAFQFVGENLRHVTDNWFITLLALPGFITLVIRKKYQIPLAFIFILSMGEASFYTEILAGMMAGAFSGEIFQYLSKKRDLASAIMPIQLRISLGIVLLAVVTASIAGGIRTIARYAPELDFHSLEMAKFVKDNTNPNSTYLFIGKINEAEWFPYLLDRTPVFSPWGSEWKGTYAEQSAILVALRGCELEQSWACMESIQQEQSVNPGLLIIPNKRWLITDIKNTHLWERIYTNERYLVWVRQDDSP